MIDVKALLDNLNIEYKDHGKNVSANDINIDCPFCGADKHLGVNTNSGVVNCWVCNFDGLKKWPSLVSILSKITNLNFSKIRNLMNEFGWGEHYYPSFSEDNGLSDFGKLPKACTIISANDINCSKAIKYLNKRNFDYSITEKYNLMISQSTYYIGRIIIPIYFEDKLVSFTSRDYTGRQDNRYKNAPLFMSTERIKNMLYNYDNAKEYEHIYLLEGPTDVWRMGSDSMSVFKSSLSLKQRNILLKLSKKSLNSITIIFDPMASMRAYIAADDLSPFIKNIKVVRLEGEKDVADRTRDEILEIESQTNYYRG